MSRAAEVRGFSETVLLCAVAAAVVLSVDHHLVTDGDPLWALAAGRWILAHHAVPRTDPFSWTAYGSPWVAQEWGFDLLLYLVFRLLGYWGLMLVTWAFLSGFCAMVWRLCRAEGRRAAVTAAVFLFVVLTVRFAVDARPEVAAYFFFAALLYMLSREKPPRVAIVALILFWANLHSSVVMGVLMVGFEAAARAVFEKDRSLVFVTAAAATASMFNPQGPVLWRYVFWMMGNRWNLMISEWRPPDFMHTGVLLMYMTILVSAGVVAYFRDSGPVDPPRRRSMFVLTAYLLGFCWEALAHARFYPYLVVVWAVFVLRLLPGPEMGGERPRPGKGILTRLAQWPGPARIGAGALVIMLMFAGLFAAAGELPSRALQANLTPAVAPVGAVNYLVAHRLTGRLFNNYTWGGYLIYRNIPVFIDGRDDVYLADTRVFQNYTGIVDLRKDPDAILAGYGVKTALVCKGSPLDRYLAVQPWRWRLAYAGKAADVFVAMRGFGIQKSGIGFN